MRNSGGQWTKKRKGCLREKTKQNKTREVRRRAHSDRRRSTQVKRRGGGGGVGKRQVDGAESCKETTDLHKPEGKTEEKSGGES